MVYIISILLFLLVLAGSSEKEVLFSSLSNALKLVSVSAAIISTIVISYEIDKAKTEYIQPTTISADSLIQEEQEHHHDFLTDRLPTIIFICVVAISIAAAIIWDLREKRKKYERRRKKRIIPI